MNTRNIDYLKRILDASKRSDGHTDGEKVELLQETLKYVIEFEEATNKAQLGEGELAIA